MRRSLRAQKAASEVLQANRVKRFPIPVNKIARKYAHIILEDMEDGISGMLIPLSQKGVGKLWAIVVNRAHSPARQNFTVAHELGHLILHGYTAPHADRGYKLRYRNSLSSEGSVLEEIEANQFAAELLMPGNLLLEAIIDEGLEYVPAGHEEEDPRLAKIARRLEVSRQALAIRLTSLLA